MADNLTKIEEELKKIIECLTSTQKDESLRSQAVDIQVQVNSFQEILVNIRNDIINKQTTALKTKLTQYENLLKQKIAKESTYKQMAIENQNAIHVIGDYDSKLSDIKQAMSDIDAKIKEEKDLKAKLEKEKDEIQTKVGQKKSTADIRLHIQTLQARANSIQKTQLSLSKSLLDARAEYITEYAKSKRLEMNVNLSAELLTFENLLHDFDAKLSLIKKGHAYIFAATDRLTIIFDELTITPGDWILRTRDYNVIGPLNIQNRPIILAVGVGGSANYWADIVDFRYIGQRFWDDRTEFELYHNSGHTVKLEKFVV